MRARQILWLLITCALLATSFAATPSAEAQSGYGALASFGGVNGQTETVLAVGDQVWVGGVFSEAYEPDHTTSSPRANLAVFDFNSGALLPIALDTNGTVKALATDYQRLVWIAGSFTEIGGESATFIAAYDVHTGALDDSFNVVLDYDVGALHYSDGWLYLGGDFGEINGLSYNKLARVDPDTGQVDASFNPSPAATVRSIDSYGDRVYAAGFFESVGQGANFAERRWIAGFDAATGLPAGPEYPFLGLQPNEGVHKAGLWFVYVSPDGNDLYTGDRRNYLRKWDRATGELLWQVGAEGDLQAVATEGNVVYAGTHDGFLAKDDGRLLFTLDAATGAVEDSFAPLMNSYTGTLGIDLSQGALLAAGDFTVIDGASAPHLAVFHGPNWAGATPLSPPQPPVPGDVGCDQQVSISDAVLIAQHLSGLRTVAPCPLSQPETQIGPGGDVNNDGQITIADAVIVAQCTAGLTNVLCP